MRTRAAMIAIGALTITQGAMLMTTHTATRTERWAARIALLVLGANSDQGPRPDSGRYSVPPFGDSLGTDEAVDALARLPKPVVCRMSDQGEVLRLRCEQIHDEGVAARTRAFGDSVGQGWTDLMRQACPGESDPLVLVSSSRDAAVVPFSSLKVFVRDYEIGHSLSWQNVQVGMLPKDVCALWTVAPPSKARVQLRERHP